jgi:hypothetical protein
MAKELTEFFQSKKQRSDQESAAIDWGKRREEWLSAIDNLYASIEGWLSEPVKKALVTLQRRQRPIEEAHLGAYSVDDLVLTVGDENVIFSPKGTNVVGAQGRVDVRGEAGESMFVVQPGPRWSVVVSRSPTLRTEALDADSFNETMQAVMRQ